MSEFTRLYRSVLRELGKQVGALDISSKCRTDPSQSVTGNKFDRPLGRRFRSIVEQRTEGARIDVQNAVDFMAAQRMHKVRV